MSLLKVTYLRLEQHSFQRLVSPKIVKNKLVSANLDIHLLDEQTGKMCLLAYPSLKCISKHFLGNNWKERRTEKRENRMIFYMCANLKKILDYMSFVVLVNNLPHYNVENHFSSTYILALLFLFCRCTILTNMNWFDQKLLSKYNLQSRPFC